MKPLFLNPMAMSGAIHRALGESMRARAMGQAEAPVYNVPTSRGSFKDQTYSELRNIQSTGYVNWRKFGVTDTKSGRKLTFYYDPNDYVAEVGGLCNSLVAFRNGLWVPYTQGAFFIEPGVFHPEKSWEQMARESDSLRAGTDGKYEVCGVSHRDPNDDASALQNFITNVGAASKVWPPPADSGDTWCIQAVGADGNVACASGSLSSKLTICAPSKYKNTRIVTSTMAAWRDTFTGSGTYKDYIFCGKPTSASRVTDPQYGHQYELTTYTVNLVNRRGESGTQTVNSEGPFVEYRVATIDPSVFSSSVSEGDWHPVTHSDFVQKLNSGQAIYPNATSIRWWDNKTMVSPEQFALFAKKAPTQKTIAASTCASPCQAAPNGTFSCLTANNTTIACTPSTLPGGTAAATDYSKYIGYGGIALGGLFLLMALTGGRDE